MNELIKAINEKDELLEKKDDLLIDETLKNEKIEKALAQENEKNKILTNELKKCNDSISSLKCVNEDLFAKIDISRLFKGLDRSKIDKNK